MNYSEAKNAGRISRDCWRGMWVDTAHNKLCFTHDDHGDKKHEIKFKPIAAELNANDWRVLTECDIDYWRSTAPLITVGG
jgi:hypothetical protein